MVFIEKENVELFKQRERETLLQGTLSRRTIQTFSVM